MTTSSTDPTQPVTASEPQVEEGEHVEQGEASAPTATLWLDELSTPERGTEQSGTEPGGTEPGGTTAAIGNNADMGAVTTVPEPIYLKGPAPTAVIIGLIGLLTLVGTAIWALTDWAVNWAVAAPVGIVLLGLVIIVLGISGLRRPRS